MTTPDDNRRVCQRCGSREASVLGVSHSLLLDLHCNTCGHTATIEHPDREAVSELANAVQAAVLISIELEAKAFEHSDEVASLQRALRRAVTALGRLQIR